MAAILLEFLRNPESSQTYHVKDWERLLRQAQAANLTARLDYLIDKHHLIDSAPEKLLPHLQSATAISNRIKEQTLREIYEISKIFNPLGYSFTVLKGAAYVAADMSCHIGRIYSDIDILISRKDLHSAEFGLLVNGWTKTEVDSYDEKYYREWMHEIPPLMHEQRYTIIDLHHNILPLTNVDSPSPEIFATQNIFAEQCGKVQVLIFEDMLIHSATHLFTESEYHNGLRDLSDIDMMLNQFAGENEHFMIRLIERSELLGLAKYLFLALRYTGLLLKNPFASAVSEENSKTVCYSPLRLKLLDFCFLSIFLPDHKSSRNWRFFLARFLLYLRGHLIRMPLRLLVPHLLHKAFITPFDKWKKDRQKQTEKP